MRELLFYLLDILNGIVIYLLLFFLVSGESKFNIKHMFLVIPFVLINSIVANYMADNTKFYVYIYNILPFIMIVLYSIVLFKRNLLYALIDLFFTSVLLIILQLASVYLSVNVLKINYDVMELKSYFFMTSIIFIFTMLLGLIKKHIYNMELNVINKLKMFLKKELIYLLSPLFILLVTIYILVYLRENRLIDIQLLYLIMILVISIILFMYVLLKFTLNSILEKTLHKEKQEQLDSYKILVDEVRGFWHNYANILQVLNLVINNENVISIQELRETLRDFVDDKSFLEIRESIALTKVYNMIITSVLILETKKARDLGVVLDIKSYGDNLVNINSKWLIEILTVFIDNAIEASYYADKLVTIKIDLNTNFKIEISNNYILENGKILKYGKSKNIGLESIKDYFKNENIDYTLINENNNYKVILEIR